MHTDIVSREPDLTAMREHLLRGVSSSNELLEQAIERAQRSACKGAFVQTSFEAARDSAKHINRDSLLGGMAVSVKDLFDLAGQSTAAGSTVLRDAPAAPQDALAVARLKAAGGIVIGRTHMTEFAYSGVGLNPHYPILANPVCAAVDAIPRITGGSSSGAAVSVACGAAYIGLGSDTGGSIRIPAALHGLVGFKPTAARVPTQGTIPLSPSLDSVGAITLSVRDAVLAHEILSARSVRKSTAQLHGLHVAVPQTLMLETLDATVEHAFTKSLDCLQRAGARITPIVLPELAEIASLQTNGGLVAAEAYAWHRHLLFNHEQAYDPRVRSRILRGAHTSSSDYQDLVRARRVWIQRVTEQIKQFDVLLSPTVPIVAPPIAGLAPATGLDTEQDTKRDAEFFRINALLLRNPSVVNLLDGCALTLPCHAPGQLPVGLMLWHGAGHDDDILHTAALVETALHGGRA